MPPEEFSCANCPSPNFIGVQNTAYQLTITDIFGCQQIQEGTISVLPNATFFIPDAFSPNADGINDHWVFFVDKRQVQLLLEVNIFDRWGDRVHHVYRQPIEPDLLVWDGGGQMPGLYLYSATLELVNGDRIEVSGSVQLIK